MGVHILGQGAKPKPIPNIITSRDAKPSPRAGLSAFGAREGVQELRNFMVDGRGPRVQMQRQRTVGGTFQEEDDKNAAADLALMDRMARILHLHYRGQLWATWASHHQGLAYISIPLLLGEHWKYAIRLRDYWGPALDKKVIEAGGEILERFKIPRGNLDLAAFLDAKKLAVPRRADARPPA